MLDETIGEVREEQSFEELHRGRGKIKDERLKTKDKRSKIKDQR
jgi:hypothetical protein